jgi:hypothetical protein
METQQNLQFEICNSAVNGVNSDFSLLKLYKVTGVNADCIIMHKFKCIFTTWQDMAVPGSAGHWHRWGYGSFSMFRWTLGCHKDGYLTDSGINKFRMWCCLFFLNSSLRVVWCGEYWSPLQWIFRSKFIVSSQKLNVTIFHFTDVSVESNEPKQRVQPLLILAVIHRT